MVMYDNEFETKKNRIWTKEKNLNHNIYMGEFEAVQKNSQSCIMFLNLIYNALLLFFKQCITPSADF